MKKFDFIKIGDQTQLTHTIKQQDIDQFVKLTGDDNKIHVDEEYASKTIYKKPIAHGMLGASFISTIIGTKLPGDGAFWFSQSLEFLLPVRVGDTITVKVKVIQKNERLKIIELQTDIFNQSKQKVTTGTAKVKMIEEKQPVEKKKNKSIKKVVLVVGGTGGIGKAVCLQLANDGFDVAIHYHNNEKLAKELQKQVVALGKKAITVGADITDFSQVKGAVEDVAGKLGSITAMVNCTASQIPNIRFRDIEWDCMQEHYDVNVKGAFNLLKCVVPIMEENKYGKIVNFSSMVVEKPSAQWAHYITAKSALCGFSRALAYELAPKGIRINLISPGMTDTGLIADIPEKVKLLTEAQTPLGALASPEDIAGAVSFLVSERSDHLSGETIRVNGGQVML